VKAEEVKRRIAEYAGLRPDPGDDSAAQVEAALFVEEVFGLRLTDEDMTDARLGSHAAIEALVLERLGGE
jgi:acyl carrier protein